MQRPRKTQTPPPRPGTFSPAVDPATYGDLLRFEERLKTNASSLQKRKYHYQLFLVQLLLAITFLLSEVLKQTRLLDLSYVWVLSKLFGHPEARTRIFGLFELQEDKQVLHPYVASGLLLVSVTTLVLFFASGTYSEKIAYANQYVPHANKALRSLNMYLNVRQPPLRSKFPLNPLRVLFPRSTPSSPPSSPTESSNPRPQTPRDETTHLRSSSRSGSPSPVIRARATTSTSRSTAVPIAPIPPTTNPRGELIFSSRVDRVFRDGYERYRGHFERRRDERLRDERAAQAPWWWWPWRKLVAVTPTANATTLGHGLSRPSSSGSRRRTPGGSISRSGTPGSLSGIMETSMAGTDQSPSPT